MMMIAAQAGRWSEFDGVGARIMLLRGPLNVERAGPDGSRGLPAAAATGRKTDSRIPHPPHEQHVNLTASAAVTNVTVAPFIFWTRFRLKNSD